MHVDAYNVLHAYIVKQEQNNMLEPPRESICNASLKSIKNPHTELGDAGSIISQVVTFTR